MTKGSSKDKDWQPQRRRDDGIHLAGEADLPANHRLRAEALVAAGRKTDPDGIIGKRLIADTADRLKAEAAAAAAEPERATPETTANQDQEAAGEKPAGDGE